MTIFVKDIFLYDGIVFYYFFQFKFVELMKTNPKKEINSDFKNVFLFSNIYYEGLLNGIFIQWKEKEHCLFHSMLRIL